MKKSRVLVGASLDFKGRAPARQLLEQADCELVRLQGARDEAEIRRQLIDIDAVLAGMEPLNEATLSQANRLKIIARNGVGYDSVDVACCTARGIVLANTPGALSDAVAEETFGLMLALTRHIAAGDRILKAGGYHVPFGEDLAVMTLGVVGCGHIGSEVVRRALAFKMRVLVYDPYVEAARIAALGAAAVPLDQLLAAADLVTLHLPLTSESRRMVDTDFLARMKPGSCLINTARGGIVDEPALIAALQAGHLAGAGLDVQVSEPAVGVSRQLVELENVVAMPHSGSQTYATRERMSVWAARSIVDLLQGREPEHVVNREVLTQLTLKKR